MHWVETFKMPIIGKNNNVLGTTGFARDITERKQMEMELRLSEEKLNLAQAVAQVGSWYLDIPANRLEWSSETYRMFGIPQQEVVDLEIFAAAIHPDDRDFVLDAWSKAMAGAPYDIEHRVVIGGHERWVRERARIERDSEGRPLTGIGTVQDITGRKLAEESLRRSEKKFRTLFDSTSDMVMMMDEKGFFDANKAALAGSGCASVEEFCSKHPADLAPPEQPCGTSSMTLANQHIATAMEKGSHRFEWMNKRADNGKIFPAEVSLTAMDVDGKRFLQVVVRDITERKQIEWQIHNLAFYDTLTQLPNRRMLNDRMNQAMASSKRSGRYGALLFLDLDNFKSLNDKYGHAVGDLLLQEVALRISGCVREMDTVARFGGDEFVVMLTELDTDKSESFTQAGIVAEKIRIALAEPYSLKVRQPGNTESDVKHHCTSSIGAVLFIGHEDDPEDLLKWADVAMYQAKDGGRNVIRFHEARGSGHQSRPSLDAQNGKAF
jgi:diguanylate cyclase (GGDEF)-like protein/PAS domain S-box-containing protein